MSTDNRKIQLETGVDTTGAKAGFQQIKEAGKDMAQSVAQSGQVAAKGLDGMGAGAGASAQKVDSATRSLIGSIQRTTAAMSAGSKSSGDYYRVLAEQRGVSTDALKPYLAQLDAVVAKTRSASAATQDLSKLTTSLGASSYVKPLGNPTTSLGATGFGAIATESQAASAVATQALQKIGVSAGQTRAALAQLPAQFSDIVVSLQGGQKPLSVLLQQGSQIKDSFGGIGPAAKALGGYVLGLVNPFTVAAAAAGTLGLAYYQGAKESENYNKALILTGNYLGTTVSQLQAYAQVISRTVGTQGAAAEALTALAGSGKVAAGSLTEVGTAVVLMNRVLGQSVDEATATFTKLADEPAKASAKLNESMHYLNLATYERIRALEQQGDKEGATALAQKSLAEATIARLRTVEASAGTLERAWRSLSDGAKAAWDAMLGIGRSQSIGDRLGQAQQKLADYQKSVADNPVYGKVFGAAGQKYQQDVADLSRRAMREQENAYAEGDRARTNTAKIAASDRLKTLSDEVKTNADKRKKAIEDLNSDFKTLGKPLSGGEYDKLVSNINDKFKDPKGAATKAYQDDAGTKLLEQLRQQEASLKEQLATSDKLTASEKEQAKYMQLFVDLKDKKQLTADQKSLLANQDVIKAQLAQNVAIEKQVALKEAAAKLDEKRKKDAEEFDRQITGINIAIASSNDSRKDQQDRSLEAFGLGDRARQEVEAQRTIRREYEGYKRQLTKDAAEKNQLGSDAYKAEVEKIKTSLDDALSSQQAYFDALRAKRQDWMNGATTALANYVDEIDDASKRAQELTTNSLNGITDGITGLLNGDKASSIKDVGKRIGQQITKGIVEQQITKPVAEWLQSSLKDTDSLVGKLLGGLTSNKGTGESWLSMLGLGGSKGADPLSDLLKSKGLLGDAGTASAATATASLAAAATSAAAALASLSASAGGSSLAGGGNLLGSLFGGASGGSDPLGALIQLNGWDRGGWTGPGGKYEPAGIVHKDEFVLNKEATNAIGSRGRQLLDRLNRRGYADGGYVDAIMSTNLGARRDAAMGRSGGNTTMQIYYQAQPGESRKTAAQNGRALADQLEVSRRRNS